MSTNTPANEFVTDTMGFVLWLERRKMPATAKANYQAAQDDKATIYIPAMVLAEILYLSERGRITIDVDAVTTYLRQHSHFIEYPLNLTTIQAAAKITDIPELHDRLIAATASHLNLPLISNDPLIEVSSFIGTIWA